MVNHILSATGMLATAASGSRRLRRLGRSHDDLMELVRGFEGRWVDF